MVCPLLPIHPSNPRFPVDPLFLGASVATMVSIGVGAGLVAFGCCKQFSTATRPGRHPHMSAGASVSFSMLIAAILIAMVRSMAVRGLRMLTVQTAERDSVRRGPDHVPRVVVMVPSRPGLHPSIVKKADACLEALVNGNPTLNITVFVFDKTVNQDPGFLRCAAGLG